MTSSQVCLRENSTSSLPQPRSSRRLFERDAPEIAAEPRVAEVHPVEPRISNAGSAQVRRAQWGIRASLIETCKLNSVEPQAYLADVLARLVHSHPMSRIDDLLPWAYAKPAIAAAA